MAVEHGEGKYQTGDAVEGEHVVVGAAEGFREQAGQLQRLAGLTEAQHRRMVLGRLVGLNAQPGGKVGPGAHLSGGGFKLRADGLSQIDCPLMVIAADFPLDDALGRNDVGGESALDGAHIQGSFIVQPAHGQRPDGPDGGVDGVDTLFRGEARVGGFAAKGDGKGDDGGRPQGGQTGLAGHVQHEGLPSLQPSRLQMGRAQAVNLLGHREHHLNGRVGQPLLPDDPERLQYGGDAGEIVRAQNGISGAGDFAVGGHNRPLARTRLHRVHMTGEKQRFARSGALQKAVEVAAAAADLRAGVVLIHREAQLCQAGLEVVGHAPLPIGGAVDGHQRDKVGYKTILIDGHLKLLLSSKRIPPRIYTDASGPLPARARPSRSSASSSTGRGQAMLMR
ncbi:hypothetical protein SDC9_99191 [bioreactor metagenome]|uniref:Uncharacterized protein n=1 Tax=bioreactor metagenome TaxID=1076179 RepID=A0A645AGU5_9ZZZZ